MIDFLSFLQNNVYVTRQVIAFDGGEVNYRAGEFNDLENISKENWDMIMDAARSDKSI